MKHESIAHTLTADVGAGASFTAVAPCVHQRHAGSDDGGRGDGVAHVYDLKLVALVAAKQASTPAAAIPKQTRARTRAAERVMDGRVRPRLTP